MESGIAVEVRGAHGEFYPGHIVAYKDAETFTFRFVGENCPDFSSEVTVHPSQLRNPPKMTHHDISKEELAVGQPVEVLLGKFPRDNNLEKLIYAPGELPPSWWPAQVSKQRGEFVVVDFIRETGPVDGLQIPSPPLESVAEKGQVRSQSHQKMLSASDFHSCVLKIPQELEKLFKESVNIQHLVRSCRQSMLVCEVTRDIQLPPACKVNTDDESTAYFLVLCTSAEGIIRAKTLGPEIIRMLRQKVAILHQISDLSRRLKESQTEKCEFLFCEEFYVSPDLIGQSIGARGANIRRARSIEGIVSVVLRTDSSTFKVSGRSKEAIENVKKVLAYTTDVMQVPQEYVARIIGQKNRHIQTLVDRVGLARIRVQSADEATVPNCVPFAFTGTRSAINDAKLLINFNIDNLKEIDLLQKSIASRSSDGDERPRRERSGRQNFPADHDNVSNGYAFHSAEGDHRVDASPVHQYAPPRRSYRRNTQRPEKSPNGGGGGTRQASLPPPIPKSGGGGHHATTEGQMTSKSSSTLPRNPGGGSNSQRNRWQMDNELHSQKLVGHSDNSAPGYHRPHHPPRFNGDPTSSQLRRNNPVPINAAT